VKIESLEKQVNASTSHVHELEESNLAKQRLRSEINRKDQLIMTQRSKIADLEKVQGKLDTIDKARPSSEEIKLLTERLKNMQKRAEELEKERTHYRNTLQDIYTTWIDTVLVLKQTKPLETGIPYHGRSGDWGEDEEVIRKAEELSLKVMNPGRLTM
jgi:hypothetical protein